MVQPVVDRSAGKYDVVFDFDKCLVPDDTKEEFAKTVYGESGVKDKIVLAAYGLVVRHYLKSANRLDEKGKPGEAEAAAEKAYGWYGKWLSGLAQKRVTDFANSYSKNFSTSGKKALLELKEKGHRLYLVSGGIQDVVETVLKENGVYGLFDGVYCNPLVTDGGSGKIERLEKRTSTPGKKVSVLEENDVDPYHTVAVGNGDFWDGRLFEKSAHPVARSYEDGFDGLVDTIESFEKSLVELKRDILPLKFSVGFARTRT